VFTQQIFEDINVNQNFWYRKNILIASKTNYEKSAILHLNYKEIKKLTLIPYTVSSVPYIKNE